LDEACGAFQQALVELGVENNVTTFTLTEFGRTIGAASDGADHAWGGAAFAFGGAVKGGEFYGKYPSLVIGSDLDIDGQDEVNRGDARGRLLPTTAVDQYAATLARWFGLSEPDIEQALPNLARFSPRDLGFMANV
jgi:uncharacterized protein (DUF1501 family)